MLLQVEGEQIYCHTGAKLFDPARPNVAFLHGALNDHSVWQRQSDYFARHGYNVLVPDLPGHGRSDSAALDSIEALAGWTLSLLDAAGMQRAMLVGHSMGALVALHAAALGAPRVSCLALLGAAFPMKVSAALLATARDDPDAAIDMVVQWSHSTAVQRATVADSGLPDQTRALMRRLSQGNPDPLLHTDLAACNTYTQGQWAIARLTGPTLLVTGRHDRMTSPKAGAALAASIAQARTVSLDSGHALMAEQPDELCTTLLDFAAMHAWR